MIGWLAEIWCGFTTRHSYRESRIRPNERVCRNCGHRTKAAVAPLAEGPPG
jgi:hypothetical protein